MINLDEARLLLLRAVETQGRDFVYSRAAGNLCSYRPNKGTADPADPRRKTGCLIGVALTLAGETRHVMDGYHRMSIGTLNDRLQIMSSDAVRYFQVAQVDQDNGASWGSAYDAAEAWVRGWVESRNLRTAVTV